MSIVSVNELGRDRTATFGEQGKKRYTRSFIVITNDEDDGPLTAASAVDPTTNEAIPDVGQVYVAGNDTDVGVRVVNIVPRQKDEEHGKVWEVLVEYDSEWDPVPDDPLQRPVEISTGFAQFQEPKVFDINGVVIANSAGQLFNPGIPIDDSRPVVTMVKNQSSFNVLLAHDFQDTVNNAAWWIFPTRTVKVANISAQSMNEAGTSYIRVTYEFHVRRDKWIPLKIANVGLKDNAGDDRLSDGRVVTEPWPLHNATTAAALGGTVGKFMTAPVAPANFPFLNFTVYRERDFTQLGVP